MGVAAVTGATGFVGNHLARLLCDRGEHVRALVRPGTPIDSLADLPVEVMIGDLTEPKSLQPFVEGVDVLYHVAADYRLWAPDPRGIYRSNVDGTANILGAALAASVPKVVYTSTVGCLGIPKDGTPGDESTPVGFKDMVGHYKRSKFLAEQVALDYVRSGLPVVIVNPSTPIGPADYKPTPTGKIIVDFLCGRMPAFVDTGLNLIDVRDVALGHLLAAERGRVGEKYILGCRNVGLRDFFCMISSCCGKRPPNVRIPYALAYVVGAASTIWADAFSHTSPGVSLESVRMARKKMYFSAEKAQRDLGLPQSPVEDAVEDAVRWFTDHGYVSGVGRAA